MVPGVGNCRVPAQPFEGDCAPCFAVEGAVTDLMGSADIKATVGLTCAVKELGNVATAIESGTSRINESVMASAKLTAALGLD